MPFALTQCMTDRQYQTYVDMYIIMYFSHECKVIVVQVQKVRIIASCFSTVRMAIPVLLLHIFKLQSSPHVLGGKRVG